MCLKIRQEIIKCIIKHAGEEITIEACGYLAGDDNTITSIYQMKNVDHSADHFSFDPREQFEVLNKTRESRLELMAVYHSHPASTARMSKEDIRMANDPNMIYIIYSILDDQLKAFKCDKKKNVTELKLELVV